MADGTLLEAEDLTLARRGEPVVRGASLRLEAGERRELTAPSGGGKTTLLLGLARLLPSGGGQLRLEGRLGQCWSRAGAAGLSTARSYPWRCLAASPTT